MTVTNLQARRLAFCCCRVPVLVRVLLFAFVVLSFFSFLTIDHSIYRPRKKVPDDTFFLEGFRLCVYQYKRLSSLRINRTRTRRLFPLFFDLLSAVSERNYDYQMMSRKLFSACCSSSLHNGIPLEIASEKSATRC
jgi:hypothetical protein